MQNFSIFCLVLIVIFSDCAWCGESDSWSKKTLLNCDDSPCRAEVTFSMSTVSYSTSLNQVQVCVHANLESSDFCIPLSTNYTLYGHKVSYFAPNATAHALPVLKVNVAKHERIHVTISNSNPPKIPNENENEKNSTKPYFDVTRVSVNTRFECLLFVEKQNESIANAVSEINALGKDRRILLVHVPSTFLLGLGQALVTVFVGLAICAIIARQQGGATSDRNENEKQDAAAEAEEEIEEEKAETETSFVLQSPSQVAPNLNENPTASPY